MNSTRYSMQTLLNFTIIILCIIYLSRGKSYKAAVVEYSSKRDHFDIPSAILQRNLLEYVQIIKEAVINEIDIIVFPEAGLTTLEINTKINYQLKAYSTEIPETELGKVACNNTQNEILSELSCASKQGIYIVVNLLEREQIFHDDETYTYYSTSLVFDRNGTFIKRYRGINPYKQSNVSSGNRLETFTTDFGVTFGILIGADILFKNPAIEMIDKHKITDVVYSTAWYSEYPFFTALGIQDGYAKSKNINLLAACLNSFSKYYNSTGSGIYLSSGKIVDTYVGKGTKIITAQVNKANDISKWNECKIFQQSNTFEINPLRLIDNYLTTKENLHNYTMEIINKTTVCSGQSDFCCNFLIDIDNITSFNNYSYKLVSFVGSRSFDQKAIAVGICALIFCQEYEEQNKTFCGTGTSTIPKETFKHISVSVTGVQELESSQPIALSYHLSPLTNYKFCTNKTVILMETVVPQDSLLVFGIFSRLYQKDGGPEGQLQILKKKLPKVGTFHYRDNTSRPRVLAKEENDEHNFRKESGKAHKSSFSLSTFCLVAVGVLSLILFTSVGTCYIKKFVKCNRKESTESVEMESLY